MQKYIFLLLLILNSPSMFAADLVVDAEIVSIMNTGSNQAKFVVRTAGGTGVCANSNIVFPAAAAANQDIYNRAYAAALMAYALGSKVRIHNYQDNACTGAAYIRLSK